MTTINPIALGARPATGDDDEFVTKMNFLYTTLEAWSGVLANVLGTDDVLTNMNTAIASAQAASQAEANNRAAAIATLQNAITALTSSLSTLSLTDVDQLPERLAALDEGLARETINRAAADDTRVARIEELEAGLQNFITASEFDLAALATTIAALNATLAQAADPFSIDNVVGLSDRFSDTTNKVRNQLPYSGTFLEPDILTGTFADFNDFHQFNKNNNPFTTLGLHPYIAGYNGSSFSTATEASRFLYNSDENGGSEGPLDSIATAFAAAMGLQNSRYSPTWAILEVLSGTGTTSTTHDGHYRMLNTTELSRRLGCRGDISFSVYIEPVDNTIAVLGFDSNSSRATYIDGARVDHEGNGSAYADGTTGYYVLPVGVVTHLAFTLNAADSTPYSSTAFTLLAKPSSRVRFAAPMAVPGITQLLPQGGITR